MRASVVVPSSLARYSEEAKKINIMSKRVFSEFEKFNTKSYRKFEKNFYRGKNNKGF